MKRAKVFSRFVFLFTAIYGMAGFYFLPMANYEGDLTRIAMLPESRFGWTKTQPNVDPALLQHSSWKDADVFVIGGILHFRLKVVNTFGEKNGR